MFRNMSPLMTELLIWAGFALVAAPIVGGLVYSFVSEWNRDTRPRDLKTLAAMKRAFRRGSKTNPVDGRRRSAIFAMQELAAMSDDAAERGEIALLMRAGISKLLHKTDNDAANEVWRMLDTLAAASPAWEAGFLELVSRSSLEGWVRGHAIQRLARIRGRACLAFLLAMADDPPVAHNVAAAIARMGPKAATPEVLARLRQMLDETRDGRAPSAATRALIALGQAADPILLAHADRLDPWTRFSVRVKAAGLDASKLIDRLFAGGLVAEKHRASIKPATVAKMRKALNEGDGLKAVGTFLKRLHALHAFDTEWDPVPDYRELLFSLSGIAAGRLTITDIDVQLDGEACREVNCVVAGHKARFNPKFMGDWTDIAAVLGGLNAALVSGGRPERFACLTSGDQTANVIIGHADGLAGLVETLGLPLDVDVNAPIAVGAGAEVHALESTEAQFRE